MDREKKELRLKLSLVQGGDGESDELQRILEQNNNLRSQNESLQQKLSQMRQHVLGKKSKMIQELNNMIQTKSEF